MSRPAPRNPPRRASRLQQDLLISAIPIKLERDHFQASIVPYSKQSFDELRAQQSVFAHRRINEPPETQVLVVPIVPEAELQLPEPATFPCKLELRMLAALIEARLPDLFPKLELRRRFAGLERVRNADDLVDLALERAALDRPERLALLHKRHRTRFSVRREFMPSRGTFLALTIEFKREFSIEGVARDLLGHGLRLDGFGLLDVDAERTWLGRVVRSEGEMLVVAGEHGEVQVDPASCRVEATMDAFRALLKQVLGERGLERYDRAESEIQGEQLTGDGYLGRLEDVATYFGKPGWLQVAQGISIAFDGLLPASLDGPHPDALTLDPVKYIFSTDGTAVDTFPFRGLEANGPLDSRSFDKKEPRVLVVCPREARHDAERFIRRLLEGLGQEGQKRFASGFVATYRLLKATPQFVFVDLPKPGSEGVGRRYVDAIAHGFDPSRRPDVAFVFIRDEDPRIPKENNPYTSSKAYLLAQGIPSQEVRLSKVRSSPSSLQYILEDIAVATYAKLGGCPWSLVSSGSHSTREIVLGMAYAEVGERFESRRRFMGIATVFNSDGTYVLAAKSPRCSFNEYPDVLASTVRDTLRYLAQYYGWGKSDRVRLVFHSSKPLTKRDIATVAATATKELGSDAAFETAFLTVVKDHPYKVVAPGARGRKGVVELAAGGFGYALVGQCVPDRGVVVNLGRSSRLVCVHGSALISHEAAGIPQPLLIKLDRASTCREIAPLAEQVYQFTGLSWGSMKPVAEPVTIHYAKRIAKMLADLDGHPAWSDSLLDTHLRTSRWFL